MIAKMHLNQICETHGKLLDKMAPWMDGELCLKAIATIESSYGLYNVPKHEQAYGHGGIYFNKLLWAKHGSWAACSYSSWQIMFPVAVELGFQGRPEDLNCDAVAIYWVMEYIEKRILNKGCTKLQDLFDAYNSGTFRDKLIPHDYIAKAMDAYVRLHTEKYGEKT